MQLNHRNEAIAQILARVELLDKDGADFVWEEAHAQFRLDKADGRRTDVLAYFENALDMLDNHRAAKIVPHFSNGAAATKYTIDGDTISIYVRNGNSHVYEYNPSTGLIGRYLETTWRS